MDAFSTFIRTVDPIIRRSRSAEETVSAIEPFLHALILDRNWLLPKYQRSIPEKDYAQYLLYRPDDHAFSVVSFVWNPQKGSPVHDHCTWGVIGQYEGVEEEARFRKLPGGGIEKAVVVASKPGDVSHVYPPDRDVHQIVNRSATPTISIHIYGGDIGSQPRHIYELSRGSVLPFVSGYDSVE